MLGACGTVPVTPSGGDDGPPAGVDGGDTPTADSAIPPNEQLAECELNFEREVDKLCATSDECATVVHPDCCGDVIISVNVQSPVDGAEAEYDSCRANACGQDQGCFHPPLAEDGQTPGPNEAIQATCDKTNRCTTVVVPVSSDF